jgi:glucan phosphoethanolaminetransferase (alkaline phosphatase superfamily)
MQEVTIAAAVGVTLGWPVAGAALLPFALYVLLSPHLLRSVQILLATLLLLLSAVAATDAYFYGHATVRSSHHTARRSRVIAGYV